MNNNPAYPNIKALFPLFFVLVFYMLLTGLAQGLLDYFYNGPLPTFVQLLAYVMAMLLTISYALSKRKKNGQTGVSLHGFAPWIAPVVIIATVGLIVGLERISLLLPMPKAVEQFFEGLFKNDLFSVIMLVVAAPVLEEILCRAIVLKGLLSNYSPRKAIILSAVFFGLIHLNPWQAIPAFVAGLWLGWIFYKTRSVIPGILVHATINGTAVLFMFFPQDEQDLLSLVGVSNYIGLCVAAAIVFVSGTLLIQRRYPG